MYHDDTCGWNVCQAVLSFLLGLGFLANALTVRWGIKGSQHVALTWIYDVVLVVGWWGLAYLLVSALRAHPPAEPEP